jgi:hypothetical protein
MLLLVLAFFEPLLALNPVPLSPLSAEEPRRGLALRLWPSELEIPSATVALRLSCCTLHAA